MKKTILITGGTGLIGTRLSLILSEKGYGVTHLSRSRSGKETYKTYVWDIDKEELEEEAIASADCIVHLAGTSVADKRWTSERKRQIIESRTKSTNLLYSKLSAIPNKVTTVIGASGINIYGSDTGEAMVTESSDAGDDFLAQVSKLWEKSLDNFTQLKLRVVKLRIGIVLSEKGGALPKLAMPVKFGVGAALGSGKQYYSWIHIDDLCGIIVESIENEAIQGAYNAVAPHPVTNKQFTAILANTLKRPLFLPNVPGFLLRGVLGEMAAMVLGGVRASGEKVQKEGYIFRYPHLEPALQDLLKKRTA